MWAVQVLNMPEAKSTTEGAILMWRRCWTARTSRQKTALRPSWHKFKGIPLRMACSLKQWCTRCVWRHCSSKNRRSGQMVWDGQQQLHQGIYNSQPRVDQQERTCMLQQDWACWEWDCRSGLSEPSAAEAICSMFTKTACDLQALIDDARASDISTSCYMLHAESARPDSQGLGSWQCNKTWPAALQVEGQINRCRDAGIHPHSIHTTIS